MNKHQNEKNRGAFVIMPLLFFGIFLSCSTNDYSVNFTHRFYKRGEIHINLDSLTSIDATSIIPAYIDDSLYLLIANELNNSIDCYNEASGKLSRRFIFEREGPDGINQIRTCVFKNKDSIYVVGKFHILRTKMITWDGEIVDGRPVYFSWSGNKYNIVNHMSTIILEKNNFYLSIGPLFDLNSPEQFKSFSYEYKYDMKQGILDELPIYAPHSYLKSPQNFYSVVPYRTIDSKGRMIHSWPNEKELEIRDLENMNIVIRKYAHVENFGKLLAGTRGRLSPQEALAEALDHVLYTQVLYDPYRNVYYRIASIPAQRYEKSDLRHWTAFGRNRVGIVAFDKDFNIIAYKILEAELYNCFRSFVGKKGLYISKSNIFRKDFDENKLEYAVFDLMAI